MSKALVLLADGLEEIEAITVVDVLRRAEVDVTTAALEGQDVSGSHEISLQADTLLSSVEDRTYDALILPGGEPGTTNLEKHPSVGTLIQEHHQNGRIVAAICAAPRILAQQGLLDGKPATSHPSVREEMESTDYREDPVVQSENVITSRGPGTAIPFSLRLVSELVNSETSFQMAEQMEFHFSEWDL